MGPPAALYEQIALVAAVITSLILACAVCGAAEKTLPTNGSEVPFEGRKRATLELRAASFETTDHALRVVELRAQPGVAMAVGPATLVSAEVPLLRRTLSLAAPIAATSQPADKPTLPPRASHRATSSNVTSLGDVELRASHMAWRSAPQAVARRLTISAGVKLPTAPLEHDPAGCLCSPSRFAMARILETRCAASATFQLQPARILATRLGAHGRLDGTGEADDEVVRRSGGASVHVAPEIVVMPTQDVVFSVGASFPLVQEMRGYRATTPVLLASLGLDF